MAPSKVAAIGSAANCCNPKPLSRWDLENRVVGSSRAKTATRGPARLFFYGVNKDNRTATNLFEVLASGLTNLFKFTDHH